MNLAAVIAVLWLALYLPALPLQAFSRALVETAPVVVYEREAARTHIVARNSMAAKIGIHNHINLATAHAMCDGLVALPREPLRETALLEQLAAHLAAYTPNIHLQSGFGALLDISASIKLFNGAEALLKHVQNTITQLRIRAHTVIAPTASGARWLSRAHRQLLVETHIDEWLDDLAFDCTDFSAQCIADWHALNLHHVGALRKLPTSALAKRFGVETINALSRAYGERNEVLAYWQPLTRFEDHVEFMDLARESTHWMPGVEQLLISQEKFLQSRAAATQHIEWLFRQGSIQHTALSVDAAQPIYKANDWLRLLNARLERNPIAHEVSRIELTVERIDSLRFVETDLFERHQETDQDWKSLLHLLKLRMGSQSLSSPHHNSNALPESRAEFTSDTARNNRLRPIWIINPPRSLSKKEIDHFIDSVHLRNPERIVEAWSQPDGQAETQRDYYIARTHDHRALWVFRERLRNDWYLQGIFA
ncbi:MAG: DNA polymerase Y family protein [Betaproteobacteria bacterium]|nr:MAG: DNA polymerase Y family protein [Betaproteobacteria bacterium]